VSGGSGAISASDLLRRLEPAVRPIAPTSAGNAAGAALFESRPFDELLDAAFRGQVPSDRAVEVACDLQPPLDAEQLQRLALTADRAEAAGAQQALMMIDGRGVLLDVASRTIVGEMKPDDAQGLLRMDTAMVVPAENEHRGGASSLNLTAMRLENPSVARLLQSLHAPSVG
jgi:hypothetical protein